MVLKYDYVEATINPSVTELRGSNSRQALHVLECLLGRDFTEYYNEQDGGIYEPLPKSAMLQIEGFTFQGNTPKRTVNVSGSSNQGLACIRVYNDKVRTTYYAEDNDISVLDNIYLDNTINARVDELLHELGFTYVDNSNLIKVLFTTQELLKRNGVKCVVLLEPIYDLSSDDLLKLCRLCYRYGNYVIFSSKDKFKLEGNDHVIKYI